MTDKLTLEEKKLHIKMEKLVLGKYCNLYPMTRYHHELLIQDYNLAKAYETYTFWFGLAFVTVLIFGISFGTNACL